jgi:hypothetical protein
MHKELIQQTINELDALSSHAYIKCLQKLASDECLGWEFKTSKGIFGQAEYHAHQEANVLLGKHEGLSEAVSQLRKILAQIETPIMEQK